MSMEQSQVGPIHPLTNGPDGNALDRVIPALYERLYELAHYRLRAAPGECSLNTTGLVHEAYLRLVDSPDTASLSPPHFLAIASRVMRNVLVDHARARASRKRGGGFHQVELHEETWVAQVDLDAVADLDEALKKLEQVDPRHSAIVECRYFGGLSLEETADALHLSLATIKRELRLARAWLAAELMRDSA
jgi:RNA polymerase sigma factor (TIGR02999 family)